MKKGRYLHYKGNYYQVLDTVKHSETEEELVLYKAEGKDQLWVRPKAMFCEKVNVNGTEIDRFTYIGTE